MLKKGKGSKMLMNDAVYKFSQLTGVRNNLISDRLSF